MFRPRTLAFAALAVSALALAGCSSSSSSPTTTRATTTTTAPVTIDTIPMADRSPAGTSGTAPTVTAASGANPTNLEATDLIPGTGTEAKVGDQVTVQYVLADTTGKVIQSSWTSQPATLTLQEGQVIQGWVDGIPGMKVGGRRELVIPGNLAYGNNPPSGSGITSDETLVFVVDLLKVNGQS